MLKTTLSAAWSRKRRLMGTTLAIVLGVAFLAATLVLGDSARSGFRTAFGEANAGTDVFARSASVFTGGDDTERPPVDSSLVETIARVDVVDAAVPTIGGTAQVLDAEGSPIGGTGPPTVASNWIENPALTGWNLVEGRAPSAPGQVVLDRATAVAAGAEVGDTATVLLPEPVEVIVSGIATFGDEDSIGGSTNVFFGTGEAQQRLLGSTALVSGVIVAGTEGTNPDDVVDAVTAVLPAGTEAITGDELTAEQEADINGDFLGFFTAALLVFALVALLVAAFSIVNTFSILVAQRTRESALLRALGASRRQVLSSALVETALVGVVGSALGVGAGVAVASSMLDLMDSAGFGLPVDGLEVTGGTILLSLLVGLAVTVLGGLAPAIRASRVAPLAALQDVAVDTSAGSRLRVIVGSTVAAVGATIVLTATSGEGGLLRAGAGAVGFVVGAILLGPVVARPVGWLIGSPLALRGTSGELARRNAVRNPRRTSATAAALLVGVGVVSLFTVFAASVTASIEEAVDRSFGGELVITPAGSGFSGAGLDLGAVETLDGLDEVAVSAGLGGGGGTLDGRDEFVGFGDPAALTAVADFDVVEGDLSTLGGRNMAMAASYAAENGYAVGESVEVGFPDGSSETLVLDVLYNEDAMGGDVLVNQDVWLAHEQQPAYFVVLVRLAGGVSLEEGRAAVEAATAEPGAPEIMDRDEFVASRAAMIDTLLNVIYGLLAVAILIALMGIANTLSLSVHERTRELGLLRAVGQSRSQLRAMVRWESVIVATFGSIGGLGVGLFLGWGLVRALNAAEGFGTYAVPVGSLAVVLVVGAAVGVLAGLRPAWRASRLDVLAAVSHD